MKKIFFLAAMFAAFAIAGYAQAKPTDFSGMWKLDTAKSKLDERMRVESMTLTVVQTDKELKVTTETKRLAPPADAPAGGPGGGRGMGRGFGGGDGTVAYTLDGKETVVEIDGPNGKMPIKYRASLDGGKMNLSSVRSFSGPMGDVTIMSKDVWTLSEDGKTLTSARENVSPRGTNTSTMIFVKG
ncbi:MAG: hypothetical protein ABI481_04465 [Pyrinomonadaceae bacterium]